MAQEASWSIQVRCATRFAYNGILGESWGFPVEVEVTPPAEAGPLKKPLTTYFDDADIEARLVYADDLSATPFEFFRGRGKKTTKQLFQILKKPRWDGSVARLSCRINDVSKNHYGRAFKIGVAFKWRQGTADSPHPE